MKSLIIWLIVCIASVTLILLDADHNREKHMHSEIFMIRSYESDTGYDRPTYRATNAHGKVEFYNDDIDGAQDEQNYTGREVVVTFDGANYINDIHLNN